MSYEAMTKEISTLTYEEQVNLLSVLVDAIKSHIPGKKAKPVESVEKKKDFSDTYPKGYFNLFGSDPTYPDEPKDLSWDLEAEKEFF